MVEPKREQPTPLRRHTLHVPAPGLMNTGGAVQITPQTPTLSLPWPAPVNTRPRSAPPPRIPLRVKLQNRRPQHPQFPHLQSRARQPQQLVRGHAAAQTTPHPHVGHHARPHLHQPAKMGQKELRPGRRQYQGLLRLHPAYPRSQRLIHPVTVTGQRGEHPVDRHGPLPRPAVVVPVAVALRQLTERLLKQRVVRAQRDRPPGRVAHRREVIWRGITRNDSWLR